MFDRIPLTLTLSPKGRGDQTAWPCGTGGRIVGEEVTP